MNYTFIIMNYTTYRCTKKLNCVVAQLYKNKAIIKHLPGVLHMPSNKMKC